MNLAFQAFSVVRMLVRQVRYHVTVVIGPLINDLIGNLLVSLLIQQGTTVSLATKPIFRFPFRMSAL